MRRDDSAKKQEKGKIMLFANMVLIVHHIWTLLILVGPAATPTPTGGSPLDSTGVSDAFIGLARVGAGFLAGVLTLFLVVQGYQYMVTDEAVRGSHAKKAVSALLGGAILILLAVTLAPRLVTAILTGQ
jgi:hypothetical protein